MSVKRAKEAYLLPAVRSAVERRAAPAAPISSPVERRGAPAPPTLTPRASAGVRSHTLARLEGSMSTLVGPPLA